MGFKRISVICESEKVEILKIKPLLGVMVKSNSKASLKLSAAGLFKYVWPFREHQALKGYAFTQYSTKMNNFNFLNLNEKIKKTSLYS